MAAFLINLNQESQQMKFIDPAAYTEKDAELDLEFNGTPIGLKFLIRPKSSEQVKAVEKKYQHIAEEQFRKKRKITLDFSLADKKNDDLVVAHIANWEWHKDAPGIGGQKPAYTEQSLRGFLASETLGPEIVEQVLNLVEDKNAFLTKSA